MKKLLVIVLLCLVTPALAAEEAPPPKRFVKLAKQLKASDLHVSGWEKKLPLACQPDRRWRAEACKHLGPSWESWLTVRYRKKDYDVELWVVQQRSAAAVKTLIKALQKESDEFGGVFGKAPMHFMPCGSALLVTVGTYRAPTPHTRVNKRITSLLPSICPSK